MFKWIYFKIVKICTITASLHLLLWIRVMHVFQAFHIWACDISSKCFTPLLQGLNTKCLLIHFHILQEKSDVETRAARRLYNPILETESTFVKVRLAREGLVYFGVIYKNYITDCLWIVAFYFPVKTKNVYFYSEIFLVNQIAPRSCLLHLSTVSKLSIITMINCMFHYISITFFMGWHGGLSPRGNIVDWGRAEIYNAFEGWQSTMSSCKECNIYFIIPNVPISYTTSINLIKMILDISVTLHFPPFLYNSSEL